MAEGKVNKIHYTSHYLKAYQRLPLQIRRIQNKKEQWFRECPFDVRLKTHKLKGRYQRLYSYWITRSLRVLFRFISRDEVIFYDIGTHSIYR